jgi:Flp pilus assembly protein TadG
MIFAKNAAQRWRQDKRSAVAIIFAISIVPLIYLIGLAVDYTFVSLDRTKVEFAAQAAATHALRIATSTYAYEQSTSYAVSGVTSAQAAADAVTAGNTAGNLWFNAEVGITSRANVTLTNSGSIVAPLPTTPGSTPTFKATVTASVTYPPFFNTLFKASAPWVVPISATAQATFSYAEILLMLDTSQSMMIPPDATDVVTQEQNTVCPAVNLISTNELIGNATLIPTAPPEQYEFNSADGDAVNFQNVPNYSTASSPNDDKEPCKIGFSGAIPGASSATAAATPCAFACHFATTNAKSTTGQTLIGGGHQTFPADYYGIAREHGTPLRIDTLMQATEQVISDMQTSQAVTGQLSVGVYQFNTDVYPLVQGSPNNDPLPEATTDLTTALKTVNGVDYTQTPTETAIPQLINMTTTVNAAGTTAGLNGDTNLRKSLADLLAGNLFPKTLSGQLQPLGASGTGLTNTTPQKFMIIVSDGLEDESTNNFGGEDSNGAEYGTNNTTGGYHNVEGEMTSVVGEAANSGTCSALKMLGFTVYVLFIDYDALANISYYEPAIGIGRPMNAETLADYPSAAQDSTRDLTFVPSTTTSPTALALQACASSSADFKEANSSASIKSAMQTILKSALASTIRLTN